MSKWLQLDKWYFPRDPILICNDYHESREDKQVGKRRQQKYTQSSMRQRALCFLLWSQLPGIPCGTFAAVVSSHTEAEPLADFLCSPTGFWQK